MEGFSGEIAELLLKSTKGNGGLIEIHGRFRRVQANTVFDEFIYPPGLSVGGTVEVLTFGGGNDGQSTVLFRSLLVQMLGNGGNVVLKGIYIFKGWTNHLQNVAVTGLGVDKIGLVYMAGTKAFAGDRITVQPKIT